MILARGGVQFNDRNRAVIRITVARQVTLICSVQHYLFRVVFDVVALQLNELIEAELAQRLSSSRILPSDPGQILFLLAAFTRRYG
jgi:hypothetical protein